jgi:hypothetical protein
MVRKSPDYDEKEGATSALSKLSPRRYEWRDFGEFDELGQSGRKNNVD